MTRIEYELCQHNHPELRFPDWIFLDYTVKDRLPHLSVEKLVVQRAADLLTRDPGEADPMVPPYIRFNPYRVSTDRD